MMLKANLANSSNSTNNYNSAASSTYSAKKDSNKYFLHEKVF